METLFHRESSFDEQRAAAIVGAHPLPSPISGFEADFQYTTQGDPAVVVIWHIPIGYRLNDNELNAIAQLKAELRKELIRAFPDLEVVFRFTSRPFLPI